jgi:hypothetical protein
VNKLRYPERHNGPHDPREPCSKPAAHNPLPVFRVAKIPVLRHQPNIQSLHYHYDFGRALDHLPW